MPLADIKIGERVRRDMGDLQHLAASMREHGLLHPVVVTPDGVLVAGHRRIEAARLLGWTEVATTVTGVADMLAAERDENAERKDFTPSEAVAIGRLIEDQHREKIAAQKSAMARQNVAKRKDRSTTTGNEDAVTPAGKTDVVASRAVGMDTATYFRAKKVVAAAEADPERFGDLPARMDETGNVSGTFRELERRKDSKGRHPVHRKSHHRNQSKEMQRAVWQIEAAVGVLDSIEPTALEAQAKAEWIVALSKVRSTLGLVLRRLSS